MVQPLYDPFKMEPTNYANTNIANCPWSGAEEWKCKLSTACPKWGCDGTTFKASCFYNGDSSYTNEQTWGTTAGTEPKDSRLKIYSVANGCTNVANLKNNDNKTNYFVGDNWIAI